MTVSSPATLQNDEPGPAPILHIGGEFGALVVNLLDCTRSGELHACVRGDPSQNVHTAVRRYEGDRTHTWWAVFPELMCGEYSLLSDTGVETEPFRITGAAVTSLGLPS